MNNLEDTFSDLASFSLANSFDENIVGGASNQDYSSLIYVAAAVLVLLLAMFIYKFYFSQKKVRFSEDFNEINNTCFTDGICSV
jgi:hypothetical protein